MKLSLMICCVASMSLAAAAYSDDVIHRLSVFHFESGPWNLQPVHDPNTGMVDAIIAIAKPDAIIGDNLNTILFIRTGTEFEAWSWRDTSRARAVYSAKMILNVPEDDDLLWLLNEELPWFEENALRPPTPYLAGMLTDDPLFEEVMNDDNPSALVDELAAMGYPVSQLRPGDGGGETGNPGAGGECFLLLGGLSVATEWALTQSVSNEATSDSVASTMASMTMPCLGACTAGPAPGGVVSHVGPTFISCEWRLTGSTSTTTMVGVVVDCNYSIRNKWYESFSTPWVSANCTPTTCDQSHYGYSFASPVSCGPFSAPHVCTYLPGACQGAASANADCGLLGPITWNALSPATCP